MGDDQGSEPDILFAPAADQWGTLGGEGVQTPFQTKINARFAFKFKYEQMDLQPSSSTPMLNG